MADDAILLRHPDQGSVDAFRAFAAGEISKGARESALAGDRFGVEPTAAFAQLRVDLQTVDQLAGGGRIVDRLGEDLGEQLVLWRERAGLLSQYREKSQVAEL